VCRRRRSIGETLIIRLQDPPSLVPLDTSPSRPRIILDPSNRRLAQFAQHFAHPLDFAHDPEHVARGDLGQVAFGEAAADQFGEEVGEAADVFEAVEVLADVVSSRCYEDEAYSVPRPVP